MSQIPSCCVITSTVQQLTQHNGRTGEKFAHNPYAIDANRRSCPNGASSPFSERLQDPLSSVRMDRATVHGGSTSGSLIPRTTLFQTSSVLLTVVRHLSIPARKEYRSQEQLQEQLACGEAGAEGSLG